jgi:hypothetical protein
VLRILRAVAWGLCLAWSAVVALLYLAVLAKSNGAVQEASVSCMACFWLILGYVCTRAFDSATRW